MSSELKPKKTWITPVCMLISKGGIQNKHFNSVHEQTGEYYVIPTSAAGGIHRFGTPNHLHGFVVSIAHFHYHHKSDAVS